MSLDDELIHRSGIWHLASTEKWNEVVTTQKVARSSVSTAATLGVGGVNLYDTGLRRPLATRGKIFDSEFRCVSGFLGGLVIKSSR